MYLTSFLKEKKTSFHSSDLPNISATDAIGWLLCFGLGEIFLQGVDEAVSDPSRRDTRRRRPRERGGGRGVELFTTALRSFDRQIAEEKNETY